MKDEKYLQNLGANIKGIRKSKNLKQTQLSELTKIEKASLSRIEHGLGNPTALTLLKISRALNVPVAEFFK